MEVIQQTDLIILLIIVSYIGGIATGVLMYRKTKGIEFVLVILGIVWIISHIYGMIFGISIDIVFNLVGAGVIAEIAGIRSAKKLKELIDKGSEIKDTINTIKGKK